MLKSKLLVIALGAAFAVPALAEDAPAAAPASPVAFNVGVVSDYIFRGITQTTHAPALQGGVDYAHASGAYAGAWASNIKWIKDSQVIVAGTDAPLELDTYFGFKNTIATDVGYDVGFIRYNYSILGAPVPLAPFNNADTAEVYVAGSYKFVSLKYSYSLLDGFLALAGAKGTNYIDLSANYPVADSGITIGAHYGQQTVTGANGTGATSASYNDYKLSVTKDFSGYAVGLAYTNTNVTPGWTYNNDNFGKAAVALSVLHSF